jgi:hypothetical protein
MNRQSFFRIAAFVVGAGVIASYAGAQTKPSDALPTGTLLMFDATTCPSGWSRYTKGDGRALFALPAGATQVTTRGTPLGSGADPPHRHAASGLTATTKASGLHSHSLVLWTSAVHPLDARNHLMPGTLGAQSSRRATMENHRHFINGFSQNAGGHEHDVSLGGSVAPVPLSALVPHIQVLVCRKN